jgi:hypothetical protein
MYGIMKTGTSELLAKFTAPLIVKSNQPVFSSDTLSLSRVTTRRANQRWEIDAGLEPLVTGANELFAHLVVNGSSETFDVKVPQNYAVQRILEDGFAIEYTSASVSGQVRTLMGSFSTLASVYNSTNFPEILEVTSGWMKVLTSTPIAPDTASPSGAGRLKVTGKGVLKASGAKGTNTLTVTSAWARVLPTGAMIRLGSHGKLHMVMGGSVAGGRSTTISIFPPLPLAVSNVEVHHLDVTGKFRYDADVISGMVYSDGIMMSTGNVKLVEAV